VNLRKDHYRIRFLLHGKDISVRQTLLSLEKRIKKVRGSRSPAAGKVASGAQASRLSVTASVGVSMASGSGRTSGVRTVSQSRPEGNVSVAKIQPCKCHGVPDPLGGHLAPPRGKHMRRGCSTRIVAGVVRRFRRDGPQPFCVFEKVSPTRRVRPVIRPCFSFISNCF